MALSLFKADENRRKWSIRGKLSNGQFVKIPAHRDRKIAEHMLRMVQSLDRSVALSELPDRHVVEWIDSLPPKNVQRLVAVGLIDQQILERRRPLAQLVEDFLSFSRSNNDPSSKAPNAKVTQIRRIFSAMGNDITVSKITKEKVSDTLNAFLAQKGNRRELAISAGTRRSYIRAVKSFFEWMVDEKGLPANPLRKLKAPGETEGPIRRRQPIPFVEFRKLADYLASAPDRYFHQRFDWTAQDRLMTYWMAAVTGFRMTELRSITRSHVNFEGGVARVRVDGWIAKNGRTATIPIPDDFATALDRYSTHLHPNAPLLRMPAPNSIIRAFYRDLDASGVRRLFDDGSIVDFHTLRSTAIYWWITENKLHILDVRSMARLSSLDLVQRYVDDYAPDFKVLVANAPRLFDQNLPERKSA